jgi:hypothetical protein
MGSGVTIVFETDVRFEVPEPALFKTTSVTLRVPPLNSMMGGLGSEVVAVDVTPPIVPVMLEPPVAVAEAPPSDAPKAMVGPGVATVY